jgi:hypothetical protein
MAVVADPDGTWLVLVRDVSHAIQVRGHSQLTAGLVLDLEPEVGIEPTT